MNIPRATTTLVSKCNRKNFANPLVLLNFRPRVRKRLIRGIMIFGVRADPQADYRVYQCRSPSDLAGQLCGCSLRFGRPSGQLACVHGMAP